LIFIDTGAFLARYIQADQFHKKASALWTKIEKKEIKCFTSNFILDELATLLFRRTGADFAESRMMNIYASTRIEILRPTKDEELTAITLMKKYSEHEISYTDCTSFCLMKKNKLNIAFTFDEHFSYAGFQFFK
jgi:predicted nucleic acid-binding protein